MTEYAFLIGSISDANYLMISTLITRSRSIFSFFTVTWCVDSRTNAALEAPEHGVCVYNWSGIVFFDPALFIDLWTDPALFIGLWTDPALCLATTAAFWCVEKTTDASASRRPIRRRTMISDWLFYLEFKSCIIYHAYIILWRVRDFASLRSGSCCCCFRSTAGWLAGWLALSPYFAKFFKKSTVVGEMKKLREIYGQFWEIVRNAKCTDMSTWTIPFHVLPYPLSGYHAMDIYV